MQGIAAAIRFARRWIEGCLQDAGIPGLLPRGYALLQHANDGIGDLLAEVPLLWFDLGRGGSRCGHSGYTSPPSGSSFANSTSGLSFSNPEVACGSGADGATAVVPVLSCCDF